MRNVASIHFTCIADLYRLDFHFIPSSHFTSAADAPSPSDFVCHLRLRGGRAPFVALRHFPRFIGDICPFHRESRPQRGKQGAYFTICRKANITAIAISLCGAKYHCRRQYHFATQNITTDRHYCSV